MSLKSRLQKLRQKFVENDIDAIFISQPENRYYLSGFDGSSGYLLITWQDTTLATDFRYTEQAKKQAPDYDIFQIRGDIAEWFPQLTGRSGLSKLGFEAGHMTFALHQKLTDALNRAKSKIKLIPLDRLVESLRVIKEPEEIESITKAVAISDAALEHIKSRIQTGMSEKEIAWEIERFMREQGSQAIPFDIIVASGSNSALPHARPSQRQIRTGEPVIIDIGARVDGYSSDLSRTICLGTGDDTFSRVYDTVLQAQLAAIAATRQGMTGEEADGLARKVIEQAGYGEAFGHSLGHGVGLAPHESPRLGSGSSEHLTDSMVFTIEPGIYLSDWGGVRIEDTVVMESGKTRVISKATK